MQLLNSNPQSLWRGSRSALLRRVKINCLFSAAFLHLHHLICNEILQPAAEYLSNIFTSFILGEYLIMLSTVNDYRSSGYRLRTWSFPSFSRPGWARRSPRRSRAAGRSQGCRGVIECVLASALSPPHKSFLDTHSPFWCQMSGSFGCLSYDSAVPAQ